MSLYNMVMGVNPYAGTLLNLLGFENPADEIPRFRDCYVDHDGNVVVFTRTGGQNRGSHKQQNAALRARPGFIRTEDWATDRTFAKWVYAPGQHAELVQQLAAAGARMDPTAKFEAAMADLNSPTPKPSTRAAIERLRPVVQGVARALQSMDTVVALDSDHPQAKN